MARGPQHILDEWLVVCAQAGDRLALNRLLQRWHPKLLRYAARQIGDREVARDVAQECLYTLAKDIRKLKDPIAFPKWAYLILHRRACDWIKQQRRHRHKGDEKSEIGFESYNHDHKLIQQGLRQLEREHYLTVYFFYLEEFSLHEISIIMDVPVGTVKSRLFKARSQLKQLLEEDHYE